MRAPICKGGFALWLLWHSCNCCAYVDDHKDTSRTDCRRAFHKLQAFITEATTPPMKDQSGFFVDRQDRLSLSVTLKEQTFLKLTQQVTSASCRHSEQPSLQQL